MARPDLQLLPLADPALEAPLRAALDAAGWAVTRHDGAPQSGAATPLVLAGTPAQALAWLAGQGPWRGGALSLFGPAPGPDEAAALLAAGLSGWWPLAALDPAQLPGALALDGARRAAQRAADQALERLRTQLDERKWVDRAKGVLMSARGIGENEAFTLLRGAAMHANLRMGEVSRAVAEAALWADALNRAGQLRMLSQRLVKLAALRWGELDARRARGEQAEARARLDENLAHLQGLPVPAGAEASWAGVLAATAQAGQALAATLDARLGAEMLRRADAQAEALLAQAELLSGALEQASGRRALHIVNLCGRQRMRVQRVAKQALLAQLLADEARGQALPALLDDFETALGELDAAPLSTAGIRAALADARDEWLGLLRGLQGPFPDGALAMSQASDRLLALFDRLTADYEHSLQVIMS